MSGTIEVRGLRVLGTHGVLAEERSRAQPFEIDLDICLELERSAASDDLADTLDYGAVIDKVTRLVSTESFRLLEALASAIADLVLLADEVTSVVVTVRKLRPPLAAELSSVGVRLGRSRHG